MPPARPSGRLGPFPFGPAPESRLKPNKHATQQQPAGHRFVGNVHVWADTTVIDHTCARARARARGRQRAVACERRSVRSDDRRSLAHLRLHHYVYTYTYIAIQMVILVT